MKRSTFGSKFGMLAAAVGSAVGLAIFGSFLILQVKMAVVPLSLSTCCAYCS